MKLTIKLQRGSEIAEHELEFPSLGSGRPSSGKLAFVLDGDRGEVDWAEVAPGNYSILLNGGSYEALLSSPQAKGSARAVAFEVRVSEGDYRLEILDPRTLRKDRAPGAAEGPQEIVAPMPGKIVKVLVEENQEVHQGEGLLVMEAMKMQNELRAPRPGRVDKIYVREGMGVESGVQLMRLV